MIAPCARGLGCFYRWVSLTIRFPTPLFFVNTRSKGFQVIDFDTVLEVLIIGNLP